MDEDNIYILAQMYDGFVEIVRQLSLSAEEQIGKLRGTVVADEIASDFSEIGMSYAQKLLCYGWITEEQFSIAKNIDHKLEIMTQKKELWNDDALLNAVEWGECRKAGKALLQMLE